MNLQGTQGARDSFISRHIGPSDEHINDMLESLNFSSLNELIENCAPSQILSSRKLDIPEGLSEPAFLNRARTLANKNILAKSHIGLGYYDCHTPGVIQRNILENPGWYTAYTPYQAEISQGRLEALLNFQTMVMELTGLEMANASLLDEATAAAEAMTMAMNVNRKNKSKKFFVSEDCFPQTIEVIRTRATPLGIDVVTGDPKTFDFSEPVFAAYIQQTSAEGQLHELKAFIDRSHDNNALAIVATDLLSVCLLKPPGEMGADIVVGSSQRFGVPMGFGGPHAAFLATKAEHKRLVPGRIIGVSKDTHGNPALRLALQTREQHIRRERATSNICTAQVLLAVMASMYAVYHGPQGLKKIAGRVHSLTASLAEGLKQLGVTIKHSHFFDTVCLNLGSDKSEQIYQLALQEQINLGRLGADSLLISLDETTTIEDVERLLALFGGKSSTDLYELQKSVSHQWPDHLARKSEFLTHPVFNDHHSETEMLRYIHRLESKDLALNAAMIPLGSCTMKLNATAEMTPITWPEFAKLHPFAPLDQAQGYMQMITQLEQWLGEITGFAGVSLQPNAGSQGEYAGLLVIRKHHQSRNEEHRDICIIPSSAHGTNPASAVLAGMTVVVVKCDDEGNIDLADLRQKAQEHSKNLAALMITYPSTHGVFEESIVEICKVIHDNGGQVYMDGANLNALVGLSKPGEFGPDVSHLNLHKTFCIPHGGGGPGVGPIGVAAHLKSFLPKHSVVQECGPKDGIDAVSAAPWGSASILPISWAYIAMAGREGLEKASQVAILNANYIAKKLEPHFPVLYKGKGGWVAHECIIDVRPFKDSADVTVDDIAKRLMDFGFHAPTMSWPVAGTLMIEPTESESKQELDRFIDAMIAIRQEIKEIEDGHADKHDNVMKNAPHSIGHVTADKWPHPYKRDKAVFPRPWVKEHKFWVPVGRVDNAYGDRNLVCSCPSIEEYA